MPTLCSIVGIDELPEDLDGEDVSDIWLNGTREWESTLYWRTSNPTADVSLKTGNWKFHQTSTGPLLYDITTNEGERDDLAEAHPEVVTQLSAAADVWRRPLPILDVPEHLGVSWNIVKEIQKRNLNKQCAKPKLKHLKQIAIDEISAGKGHRYLTVVLDLASGAVVFVVSWRRERIGRLHPFWKRLLASHARVEAVATDMSSAYIEAVTTNLPKATHVFDRFHVMNLYNEKISALRRDVQREAEQGPMKETLKGTRWLLMKNPGNLDCSKNEHQRLAKAVKINEPLALAYYMKEDLREVWEQDDGNAPKAT